MSSADEHRFEKRIHRSDVAGQLSQKKKCQDRGEKAAMTWENRADGYVGDGMFKPLCSKMYCDGITRQKLLPRLHEFSRRGQLTSFLKANFKRNTVKPASYYHYEAPSGASLTLIIVLLKTMAACSFKHTPPHAEKEEFGSQLRTVGSGSCGQTKLIAVSLEGFFFFFGWKKTFILLHKYCTNELRIDAGWCILQNAADGCWSDPVSNSLPPAAFPLPSQLCKTAIKNWQWKYKSWLKFLMVSWGRFSDASVQRFHANTIFVMAIFLFLLQVIKDQDITILLDGKSMKKKNVITM